VPLQICESFQLRLVANSVELSISARNWQLHMEGKEKHRLRFHKSPEHIHEFSNVFCLITLVEVLNANIWRLSCMIAATMSQTISPIANDVYPFKRMIS
jgi:hypothetical protein